jgi:hypothetical protein
LFSKLSICEKGFEVSVQEISISKLTLDPERQMRVHGCRRLVVKKYADALEQGAEFPPIIVVKIDKEFVVCDGFHRISAHESLGLKKIKASIEEGDEVLAMERSFAANGAHGESRSKEDEEMALMKMIAHPVIGQRSLRDLGKLVGLSHTKVSQVRRQMEASGLIEPKIQTLGKDNKMYPVKSVNAPAEDVNDLVEVERPQFATAMPPDQQERNTHTTNILLSSKSNEWYSGDERLLKVLHGFFKDGIDLDPASCAYANETFIKAARFYSEEDDGLSQPWDAERLWCNPPYGLDDEHQSNMGKWSSRWLDSVGNIGESVEDILDAGMFVEGLLLVNAFVGAKWFERLWSEAFICFPNFRLKHKKAPWMKQKDQPSHFSAISYVGPRYDEFKRAFSVLGRIVPPSETFCGHSINHELILEKV